MFIKSNKATKKTKVVKATKRNDMSCSVKFTQNPLCFYKTSEYNVGYYLGSKVDKLKVDTESII